MGQAAQVFNRQHAFSVTHWTKLKTLTPANTAIHPLASSFLHHCRTPEFKRPCSLYLFYPMPVAKGTQRHRRHQELAGGGTSSSPQKYTLDVTVCNAFCLLFWHT